MPGSKPGPPFAMTLNKLLNLCASASPSANEDKNIYLIHTFDAKVKCVNL